MSAPNFPALLQRFFTERLVTHQDASPHTVAAYRDTFRMLFAFVRARVGRAPSALRLDDLDAPCLEAFLVHLERDRHNHPRTRNQRLAALHGFFRYVALQEPAYSLHCQRVLAIPPKRCERGPVAFLTDTEMTALIAAPDPTTWIGRRDRTLLLVATQTGLRNSELSPATGCRPRCGPTHSMYRERSQGPRHAVATGCRRRAHRLARARCRHPSRPRVSECARWPPQPRCSTAARYPSRHDRTADLPVAH